MGCVWGTLLGSGLEATRSGKLKGLLLAVERALAPLKPRMLADSDLKVLLSQDYGIVIIRAMVRD